MTEFAPTKVVPGSPNTVAEMTATDTIPAANLPSAAVTLTGTQTVTNKTFTAPKIGEIYQGTSVAPVLVLLGVPGSTQNYIEIQNQIGGAAPRIQIASASASTNVDLLLASKGSGKVRARYGGINYDLVDITSAQTLAAKTLTQPVIADFTAAQHSHLNAAGGGTLSASAFAPGQGLSRVLYAAIATSASISNTTTETAFSNLAYSMTWSTFAQLGQVLKFTFQGRVTTTSTPKLQLKLRGASGIGTLWDGGSVDMPTGATNAPFMVQLMAVVRAIGAGGQIAFWPVFPPTYGALAYPLVSTFTSFDFNSLGGILSNLELSATWSVAAAGNAVYLEEAVIEALN